MSRSPFYMIAFLTLCVGLFSCTTESERRQMAQIIAEADSMNRNYIPLTNDSLLMQACKHYDRHGTPNERMKAHYLLGCVYRDQGEAPRAIECYQDAAACADTTAQDCDFQTLGCVYSQMGDIYHRQMLLNNEIHARKQAMKYAFQAKDTINGIYDYMFMAGACLLQNKNDSAEFIAQKTIKMFEKFGKEDEALETTLLIMYILSERPERLEELQRYIFNYDLNSKYFDAQHELPPYKRQFYYYKGKYYEMACQLDSAEVYYRKIYRPRMSCLDMVPLYRGLLDVFQKRNITDSITKYAKLYCEVNDSSVAIKDQEQTARLAASYRYNTIQREALEHEREANQVRTILFAVIAVVVLIAVAVLFSWFSYKKQKEKELNEQKSKYADAVDTYNHNLLALRIIDDSRKASIEEMQKKLASMEEELRNENDRLRETITGLQKAKNIRKTVEHAQNYYNEPIVQRVHSLINEPLTKLTNSEKEELLYTTSKYYHSLINDIKQAGITPLGVQVCILVILQINSSSISNLLGISIQQVTNLKSMIGNALFGERSARILHKKLIQKYDIYIP